MRNSIRYATVFVALMLLKHAPLYGFVNNQNAQYVIGQPNFTTFIWSSGSLNVTGAAYDSARQWLFEADYQNNRVLIFKLVNGITNGMAPDFVLGQPNSMSITPGVSPPGMSWPIGVAYDPVNKRLFVGETHLGESSGMVSGDKRTRVSIYDLSVTANVHTGMPAVAVLGQPDLNTVSTTLNSQASMADIGGVTYDPNHHWLFVTDGATNNRVLVFDLTGYDNSVTITQSPPLLATAVLGQPDFSTFTPATSQKGMSDPMETAYDAASNRLFVSDTLNNRVLIFMMPQPLTAATDMPASYVLGQPVFSSSTLAFPPTQNGMGAPIGLAYDAQNQRLFVGDARNNRVLIFNLWGGLANATGAAGSGMNASTVLGEPNFTSGDYISEPATQSDIFSPVGLTYDGTTGMLFVNDDGFSRTLVFVDGNLASTPNPCGPSAAPTTICGTVTDVVNSATLQGVPIQLFNAQGGLMTTQKTQANGTFAFNSGLTLNTTYYVTAAVDRTESASPIGISIQNLTNGATGSMQIRGWPGTLEVNGSAGSAVLLSTSPFTQQNAPPLNPSLSTSNGYYAGAIEANGTAMLLVPNGSYYLTCWVASPNGNGLSYTRDPALPGPGSAGPYLVQVNQTTTGVSCP